MLHLPRLLRRSTEKENAACQSVEPVYRPQVFQIVLLREDEDDRVVPVSAARVHLQSQRSTRFSTFYPPRKRNKLSFESGKEREGERERGEEDEEGGLCNRSRWFRSVKNIYSRRKAGKDRCICWTSSGGHSIFSSPTNMKSWFPTMILRFYFVHIFNLVPKYKIDRAAFVEQTENDEPIEIPHHAIMVSRQCKHVHATTHFPPAGNFRGGGEGEKKKRSTKGNDSMWTQWPRSRTATLMSEGYNCWKDWIPFLLKRFRNCARDGWKFRSFNTRSCNLSPSVGEEKSIGRGLVER